MPKSAAPPISERKSLPIGALLVRADTHAVKIPVEPEHPQLVFGEGALGVREQIYPLSALLKGVEQVDDSVIEAYVFGRKAAERRRREQNLTVVDLGDALLVKGAEHLFYFNVDHAVFGMPPAHRLLFALNKAVVLGVELAEAVDRSAVGIEHPKLFPELIAPLVGVDVDQGAVKVENIVLIHSHTSVFCFYSTNKDK